MEENDGELAGETEGRRRGYGEKFQKRSSEVRDRKSEVRCRRSDVRLVGFIFYHNRHIGHIRKANIVKISFN